MEYVFRRTCYFMFHLFAMELELNENMGNKWEELLNDGNPHSGNNH